MSIISYPEERHKFGEDEAGESISAKIKLLEVKIIKIIVPKEERKHHARVPVLLI